jgi:hypothetical protein
MFAVWEPIENKKKLIEFLVHNENEEEGTLILLSDDAQDKIKSFLNEDGVIDEDNEEANEYLDDLNEEFSKFF